jgi:hypothetical protein
MVVLPTKTKPKKFRKEFKQDISVQLFNLNFKSGFATIFKSIPVLVTKISFGFGTVVMHLILTYRGIKSCL